MKLGVGFSLKHAVAVNVDYLPRGTRTICPVERAHSTVCGTLEVLHGGSPLDHRTKRIYVRVTCRVQELALRYVLEDGKLNVCLRNLVEWREFDRMRRTSDPVDEKPSVRRAAHHIYIAHVKQDYDILTLHLSHEFYDSAYKK